MLRTYQIRRLSAGLWQVLVKFENGDVEHWVGFNSELEAREWVRKKFLRFTTDQKSNAAA
jgi:hypothetical protein